MKLFSSRLAAIAAGALLAVSLVQAPAHAQLPDISAITAPSSQAAFDANRAWNGLADQINSALPQGSSVPRNIIPQPAPINPPAAAWRPAGPQPVGNGHSGELSVNGRGYLIHVPHGYNPSRAWPVMVAYSAYQDTAEHFRGYSRLRESAVGRDAIIVYPRAIGRSWEGSPTAATRPGQDIAFVRAMINDLHRHYNIDRGRIYATGMSTGGGMAAVSACHMADIFAGVAGVSGAYYAPVNAGCQNIPVAFLAYHGTGDTLTNYHGGVRHGVPYLGVPQMFSSYERRNGCHVGRISQAPVGFNATRVSANGCSKPVQSIKVHGSNHTWWYNPSVADDMWAVLSHVRK